MNEDDMLACRAITEGWPITQDQRTKCVARLEEALDNCDDHRDVARIVKAFAQLNGQNLQVKLAEKYIAAGSENVVVRPLHEEIAAMINTLPLVPQEYIVKSEVVAEEQNPNASCPRPAAANGSAGF